MSVCQMASSITAMSTSYTAQFGTTPAAYPYSTQLLAGSPTASASSSSSSSTSSSSAPPTGSSSAAQLIPSEPATASSLSPAAPTTAETNTTTQHTQPCCETGRPIVTDPVTGQTVCSCQYDRLYGSAMAAARLYGAYPSTDQNPYPSLGMDSTTAFYSSLTNPYSLTKDGGVNSVVGPTPTDPWSTAGAPPVGLHQSAPGYYPYDPALAAYGYGASYDLAARRKNATRESTATLKAWLSEHKKNPYPTKGEKIMLAIITKMTLTQVSTWFANARRRLKKENKMTWEPKNRNDEDDDDDCGTNSGHSDDESSSAKHIKSSSGKLMNKHSSSSSSNKDEDKSDLEDQDSRGSMSPGVAGHPHHHHHMMMAMNPSQIHHHQQHLIPSAYHHQPASMPAVSSSAESSKPKIWSLADTAACKTPPPPPVSSASSASAGMAMAMAMAHPAAYHHPSLVGPPSHHSWFSSAGAAAGKMAAYRYPTSGGPSMTSSPSYGPSASSAYGGDAVVQTDTPPQTPPNLKMAGHHYHHHQYQHHHHPYQQRPATGMSSLQQQTTTTQQDEMLISPGRHHPHQMADASSSSSSANGTAFRPVYRTSPVGAAGYVTSS